MMKRIRLKAGIFPLILGLIVGSPVISVYASETGSMTEAAGKTSIVMREKGTNDARKQNLLPSEEVPYVLTVYNESDPVYVRVKVDIKSERDFDDSILTGISDDWQKKCGYFYYVKPVQKEEEIIFSKGVQVPDLKRSDGEKFSISSEAQAVQAEGFLPDFASDKPWGDEKELDFTEKVPERGDSKDDQGNKSDSDDDSKEQKPDKDNGISDAESTDKKNNADGGNESSAKGSSDGNTSSGSNSSGSNSSDHSSSGSGSSSGSTSGKASANDSTSGKTSSGSGSSSGSSKKSSFSGGGGSGTVRKGVSVSSDKAGIGPGFALVSGNSSMYKNPYGVAANTFTDGQWQLIDKDQNHWSFLLTDGTAAKGGWLYLKNPYGKDDHGKASWFKFNENGRMETGWILSDDGNWYFAHDISDGNLGVLAKGWHTNSQDNKKYYLHPDTGHMLTGWQKIGEKYYYFATADDIPKQTWFFQTNVGKWLYDAIGFRSYGSMYQNERTPDGRLVDAEGAYIPG